MHYLFFVFIFSFLFTQLYSQEDSLHAHVNRVIMADKSIESYIDVNDSVSLFLDEFEKKFGITDENNGTFFWSNIKIDSINKPINIKLMYGLWITKKSSLEFKPISTEKKINLKSNEKLGIRIRFTNKDNKDVLYSKQNETILLNIIDSILNNLNNNE